MPARVGLCSTCAIFVKCVCHADVAWVDLGIQDPTLGHIAEDSIRSDLEAILLATGFFTRSIVGRRSADTSCRERSAP